MSERPIFLFSAGWRTGSTLLQRVLCSHGDILVWGENRGIFGLFEQAGQIVDGLQKFSRKHAENYRESGSMGWIAAMNPPPEHFREGLRRLLETYYRDPARQMGKSRWGFKEVRHGLSTARFLHGLYPSARFLLLLRHPEDCLASARATTAFPIKPGLLAEVGGPRGFLEHWVLIAASFLEDWTAVPHLTVRYELLIRDPGVVVGQIARFLDTSPADFDLRVFDVRRRGWLGRPPRLTAEDRQWLESGWIWEVARRHGYEPR
jgi:hypothetical protein